MTPEERAASVHNLTRVEVSRLIHEAEKDILERAAETLEAHEDYGWDNAANVVRSLKHPEHS